MEKLTNILLILDESILELKKLRKTSEGLLRRKYNCKIKVLCKEKYYFEMELSEIQDALSQTLNKIK